MATSRKKRFEAAVVGGTGYGGAELIRLLLRHPAVELTRVTSIDHVGEAVEALHRSFPPTGLVFENLALHDAARDVDVVFLALPHKVAARMARELEPLSARVIDLSGDFRLRDASSYARYYGAPHPHPEFLGTFVYGLPELYRDAISAARRVSSPGCFATCIAVGLLPLARAGLLQGSIRTVACTGSSGSGAYASDTTHHPLRASNLKPYKPLEHQHIPEIEQTLADACHKGGHAASFRLQLVPVSAPLTRGILATSFVQVPGRYDQASVRAIVQDAFAEATFVRVLDSGPQAEVVAVKGTMWLDVSFALAQVDPANGCRELVVMTALDNLVKGGAGQAVQSMNLMLGLPESQGLDAPGLWP